MYTMWFENCSAIYKRPLRPEQNQYNNICHKQNLNKDESDAKLCTKARVEIVLYLLAFNSIRGWPT